MTGDDKLIVIGVDPGPTTGIVELMWSPQDRRFTRTRIVQCNADAAMSIVDTFVLSDDVATRYLAVERFVDGFRAGRGNTPAAAQITRDIIAGLTLQYTDPSVVRLELRSASEVKPWAIDERLFRVGLYNPTKGMQHARDAARHALFSASKHGAPDPLSARTYKALDSVPARGWRQ